MAERPTRGGDLDDIRAFCAVVEFGTISSAARHLKETKGGTSRRISRLEKRLGIALLARTPRAVSTTAEGAAFYAQASRALSILRDAAEAARQSRSVPSGHLRITASLDIGIDVLPEALAQFHAQHPQITVELMLTDAVLDLAANRIDLALRASDGALPDTPYHASTIAEFGIGLYASPDYLRRKTTPKQPRDLNDHSLVVYRAKVGVVSIPLTDASGRVEHFVANPVLRTSNYSSVCSLVRAGVGIGGIPDIVARASLERGELVRVLPGWTASKVKLHALTLAGRDAPARVQAFRECLKSSLSKK